MDQFHAWTNTLASHASDADIRKSSDPSEGPKHYINIDSYPGFLSTKRIPQTLDSVITLYGYNFVNDAGYLPWATKTAFDSLKNCILRLNWAKAVLFASDLGHYIADGHMPLHLTKNYDGQYSNNSGIHSRYETTMIGEFISQITYSGDSIQEVLNVNQYIFNYIYENYVFVDSVLLADTYAKTISSNTATTAYKQALWERTKQFTIPLFKKASHSLAELIYTAWIQAGSPIMTPIMVFSSLSKPAVILEQNYPNPFKETTQIKFFLNENSEILLQIRDVSGKTINTLFSGTLGKGNHTIEWDSQHFRSGVYYTILTTGATVRLKKMILLK